MVKELGYGFEVNTFEPKFESTYIHFPTYTIEKGTNPTYLLNYETSSIIAVLIKGWIWL